MKPPVFKLSAGVSQTCFFLVPSIVVLLERHSECNSSRCAIPKDLIMNVDVAVHFMGWKLSLEWIPGPAQRAIEEHARKIADALSSDDLPDGAKKAFEKIKEKMGNLKKAQDAMEKGDSSLMEAMMREQADEIREAREKKEEQAAQ